VSERSKDDRLQFQPADDVEPFVDNEDSDSDDSDEGGQSRYPPPTSGGKWLPGFRPQRATSVLWKTAATPEHSKPVEPQQELPTASGKRLPEPPPSHTRGKWDSTQKPWGVLKKPSGEAFWCGPCNRRLSSRLVYERHIKSELHFKRTNPWCVQTLLGKRTVKRSRVALESSLSMFNKNQPEKKKRLRGIRRLKNTIICEVCNYRVAPHLMGKHLISHYHCNHPRPNDEANNAMVLRHMDSIVRQAPFQCGLCKFYCNNQQAFLDHWASEMHQTNDQQRAGIYWCANCNFKADSYSEMGRHLGDQLHEDRVAIIDLSVPVVIQKITPLQCDVCGKCFRYNAQDSQFNCDRCAFTGKSETELLVHKILHESQQMEGSGKFECSFCRKTVNESYAKKHMMTHTMERPYSCHICSYRGTLERHMQTHYGKKFPCPEEGCIFEARSQGELTIHSRTHSDLRQFKCTLCSYSAKTKNQLVNSCSSSS
ncbi:unnamed protein product, partial [Nesidiocoris tenuis]